MTKYDVILERIGNMHDDILKIERKIDLQNGTVIEHTTKIAVMDTRQKLIITIGSILVTTLVTGLIKVMFF